MTTNLSTIIDTQYIYLIEALKMFLGLITILFSMYFYNLN